MTGPRRIERVTLITHTRPDQTRDALLAARAKAEELGAQLVLDAAELAKHGGAAEGLRPAEPGEPDPDLCLVLGGDGAILNALGRYAHTDVPVFGLNFGTIGFLATADPDELDHALTCAFGGSFDVMKLPGLELRTEEGGLAINDVSFARHPHGRVAELAYTLAGQEIGHVRCDGLVAATPAGSTGYNLANNGPVLAWGVEGYVVSFIAPHTLTARALVAAPGDILCVTNAPNRDPVDIVLDGVAGGQLQPGESVEVGFRDDVAKLAQLPGATFYRRIREKFGRLAR